MKIKLLGALCAATLSLSCGAAGVRSSYQDWWWDPDQSGMGLNVAQQKDHLVVSWYFFDDSGQGTYLMLSGELRDGVLEGDLARASGPVPGPGYRAEDVERTLAGTAKLVFSSLSEAVLTYDFEGKSGSLRLQRFGFNSKPVVEGEQFGFLRIHSKQCSGTGSYEDPRPHFWDRWGGPGVVISSAGVVMPKVAPPPVLEKTGARVAYAYNEAITPEQEFLLDIDRVEIKGSGGGHYQFLLQAEPVRYGFSGDYDQTWPVIENLQSPGPKERVSGLTECSFHFAFNTPWQKQDGGGTMLCEQSDSHSVWPGSIGRDYVSINRKYQSDLTVRQVRQKGDWLIIEYAAQGQSSVVNHGVLTLNETAECLETGTLFLRPAVPEI